MIKKKSTAKHIFTHLCDQMDKLSSHKITVEEAKAQAHLARQANGLLRYELDRARTVAKHTVREIEE